MRLRPSKDEALVAALHRRCFPDDDYCLGKGVRHWVLYDENISVGFCSLIDWGRGVAFLARAGVLPIAQGQGMHRRMIRHRLRWAKRNGFDRVWTYTTNDNVRSANNLIRCGFRVYAPKKMFDGGYIFFEKFL